MKNELFEQIIAIFLENLDQVDEYVNEENGMTTYSTVLYRPIKNVKNFYELKDLSMTGFKIFVEVQESRIILKLFELELITRNGKFPQWHPLKDRPLEQIFIKGMDKDSDRLFVQFDNFLQSYNKWREQTEVKEVGKILEDFKNYKKKLTWEDPFQHWLTHQLEEEMKKADVQQQHAVESYQEEPDIMDFERKDKDG